MSLKTTSFFILLLVAPFLGIAQRIASVGNFMNNQLIYNPAAAGMHEAQFNTSLVTSFQMTGVEGAPLTNFLWADYRSKSGKSAIGLNLNYDKFGVSKNTDIYGNYSYNIRLNRKLKLAFGLKMGITRIYYSTSDLTRIWDPGDVYAANITIKTVLPKAGAGLQLQSKKSYIGFSLPDLITYDKNNVMNNDGNSFFKQKRNYTLMAGTKYKINDSYSFNPNVMVFYYPGASMILDVNALFEITDYFWAGGTYSTSHQHSLMAGTNISSRIKFGYAYRFKTGPVTLSTHELNLRVSMDDLFSKKK